jgi:integrase
VRDDSVKIARILPVETGVSLEQNTPFVGVTLHSYRYAWAERAKTCAMPERFAQEALGHNSKAVHRAYANGL